MNIIKRNPKELDEDRAYAFIRICDTNILISAYRFAKSKPDQVLEKVRQGEIELIVSPPILLEFQNVLRRKFDRSESLIKGRVEKLLFTKEGLCRDRACPCPKSDADSHKGCPYIYPSVVEADESDNRILECAVVGTNLGRGSNFL